MSRPILSLQRVEDRAIAAAQGALNRQRGTAQPKPRCEVREALDAAYIAYVQQHGALEAACWASAKACRLYVVANDTKQESAKTRANRLFAHQGSGGR